MKPIDVAYKPGKEYRELFMVCVNANKCTDDVVGITEDNELLYIKERLANHSSAYWVARDFFTIDKAEFRHYLSLARKNGGVEKAVKNGHTTLEELESLTM